MIAYFKYRYILVYKNSILSLIFYNIFIYLFAIFLTAPSLPCSAEAFFGCRGGGATLHCGRRTSQCTELSCCRAPTLQHRLRSCGLWNLSRPGINPTLVPALASRFLPTDPPGKTFDSFNMCVLEKVFCTETFMCPIIIPLWKCAFDSFPRLGKFSAIISMHNLSDPFSLSSAFETPSILLTWSSSQGFSENIFIKKKKKFSSVLPST